MPMTQDDIRSHYRKHWQDVDEQRGERGDPALRYSSPVEDGVLYPVYEALIRDYGLMSAGAKLLDIGCGSGRWVRFFLDRFQPATLVGLDFAEASVAMLRNVDHGAATTQVTFEVADITDPAFQPPGQFDLVNVANVLFHIPEDDRYSRAVTNLARCLAPGGAIVSTEYLPRIPMRTEWMRVRSRYEFTAICEQAGLQIIDTRASCFFSNDPMGLDGPDNGARLHFNRVRAATRQLLASASDDPTRQFLVETLTEIERACMTFCSERLAQVEMPSQKLVLLRRAQ